MYNLLTLYPDFYETCKYIQYPVCYLVSFQFAFIQIIKAAKFQSEMVTVIAYYLYKRTL